MRVVRPSSGLSNRLHGIACVTLLLSAFAAAAQTPITVTVDAMANRHAINPLIYGLSIASTADLQALNAPFNRLGGNNTSRYNWQVNADNRDFDWYFESLPYSSATPGEGGDTFIQQSQSGGAQPLITIPMIGWVAKLGPSRGHPAAFLSRSTAPRPMPIGVGIPMRATACLRATARTWSTIPTMRTFPPT